MADNKKSFILYVDSGSTFEALEDDEAGRLIKHIFRYVSGSTHVAPDKITQIAFESIKQQLKRDLVKYESICDRNKGNGLKGGRPKKESPDEPKKPSGLFTNPDEPKKADSDNDNVNVNDNENNIERRKLKFASTLKPFIEKYGKDLIRVFYEYWTEPNELNSKFRKENEKHWGLERRLKAWAKGEKQGFKKPDNSTINFKLRSNEKTK